jgi:hypothetical protein
MAAALVSEILHFTGVATSEPLFSELRLGKLVGARDSAQVKPESACALNNPPGIGGGSHGIGWKGHLGIVPQERAGCERRIVQVAGCLLCRGVNY